MTRTTGNPLARLTVLLTTVAILPLLLASRADAIVDAQLNLRYNNPADESAGGTWQVLVQSTVPNGLAGIDVQINGATGVTGVDIGPVTPGAFDNIDSVFRFRPEGAGIEVVAGDDLSGSRIIGVGTGAGTPGNVPEDDLFPNAVAGDQRWDNSGLIASGEFGATRPQLFIDGANEYNSSQDAVPAVAGTVIVRGDAAIDGFGAEEMLFGDADRSGRIDNNDFNIVVNNFNTSGKGWDTGDVDGTSTGQVNNADRDIVLDNFYQSATDPGSEPLFTTNSQPSNVAAATFPVPFTLDAEVTAAFDLGGNPVALPNTNQPVGTALVYQVDFSVETLAVFPTELGFANVGFSIATDNLDTSESDWTPSALAALSLETNLDAGVPDDLEGILASIAGGLDDPNDIRTQIGQNGPTVIGSILVQWDGVTPASLSTEDVLFSANSASGMFLAAQGGASSLLQFGNVPEPTSTALLLSAVIGCFSLRQRSTDT